MNQELQKIDRNKAHKNMLEIKDNKNIMIKCKINSLKFMK